MISIANLKSYSLKDLAQIARNRGVRGWHAMRKDQLIRALTRVAQQAPPPRAERLAPKRPVKAEVRPARRPEVKAPAEPRSSVLPRTAANGSPKAAERISPAKREVLKRIERMMHDRERLLDLSAFVGEGADKPISRDRLVLMVRDPYWLHAFWEVRKQSVQRAQAALAEHWHTARPVLRLLETVDNGTTNTSERLVREIEIHGGVRNWYIDVSDPPHSYRVEIGYKGTNGAFFAIARSNMVSTGRPGELTGNDGNWADVASNYEKVYALSGGYANENGPSELQELFEERLRRPMGSPATSRFGDGAVRMLNRERHFKFDVEVEMLVTGQTNCGAYVTLGGEPVKLNADGTFTLRLPFPDRRQVLPLVGASADGVEQRTVVVAVERNTKVMEPVMREYED